MLSTLKNLNHCFLLKANDILKKVVYNMLKYILSPICKNKYSRELSVKNIKIG